MNVGNWIKKNASTILTCFGAGGVVATIILAVKATPKAMDRIQTARIDKKGSLEEVPQARSYGPLKARNVAERGEEILRGDREGEVKKNEDGGFEMPKLTFVETVQTCWKEYIPTVAVGTASLMCIFGANALDRRQQASMAAAYTALAGAFEGYRDKARAICGPGTDAMIDKAVEQEKKDAEEGRPPWDEKQTFYLDCLETPSFFERTMEQVMRAEYHINRNLQLRGNVTLNEFLSFLDLKPVKKGDELGWELYDGEAFYGYRWIDFDHPYRVVNDDLVVREIDMPFPPHPLNESEWMFSRENSSDCYEEPNGKEDAYNEEI